MRLSQLLLTVLCSSVLAACGGGDDAPAAASGDNNVSASGVADKYVGTWTVCESKENNSGKFTVVNTKTSATSVRYSISVNVYLNSTTCQGTGVNSYTEVGDVAYKGSQVIGSDTVDLGEGTVTSAKGTSNTGPRVVKNISLVSGSTMYFGDEASTPDADGYPTAIDRSFFLTKQ